MAESFMVHRARASHPRSSRSGFTLLEMLVVVCLALVLLGMATGAFGFFLRRSAAFGAAQIFTRDLSLARLNAVQTRAPVVVRFGETDLEYVVETSDGRRLASRRFAADADLRLSELDLDMSGDSLVFDGRGVLDLSGGPGTLGTATFTAAGTEYTVSFNSLGAARIDDD